MSDAASNPQTGRGAPAPSDVAPLPPEARAHLNGQLDGQAVVAWSEFDLDASNRYTRRFAILTDQSLVVVGEGQAATSLPVRSIEKAKIVEGLGVDKLVVRAAQIDGVPATAIELRYTKRHTRDMARLLRKVERRMPRKAGDEAPPDWLENVERQRDVFENCPRCGQSIPAYAEGVCPRCAQQKKILWRLLGEAKPYRRRVFIALALTITASLLTAVPPICHRHVIDDAIRGGSVRALVLWSCLLVGTILVQETLAGLRLRQLVTLATFVARDLRHKVYAHLHELSLRYFAKRRTGSLITRVTNDTDRLWDFIVMGSVDMVRNVVMVLVIVTVMLTLNWRLAMVGLLPLPVLAVVTYFRSMTMQRLYGKLWTYWSRLGAVVGDVLPGVKVVKAFSNEEREVDRFDRRSVEYSEREREINEIWSKLQPLISGTMRLGAVMVLVVGGYMVIRRPETVQADGTVVNRGNTIGMLIAFTQFLWQFYVPIMELANSNRMVTRAATSAQRVFEVLDTPPEIYSKSDAAVKDRLEGRVEFRQVSFSYEGTAPALREVSIAVEPGEMIGLCGPSGAGKSTFVNLLCRFYDVTDGQILLDGTDLRDYDVNWLRRQIGIVLQEPYLFHGTVADNIRYGHPEASEADVIRAAKAANAHDFIVGFPDGYDTMVGERGQSLSGGERQRVSIARAILHNPRILILDEATSSVDTETEKQIQEALDRLVAGRTTFAIAHRLSTLQAADRLVVLEKGRIVEQGGHAELVNKEDGVYAKLHRTQMEMSAQVAISG